MTTLRQRLPFNNDAEEDTDVRILDDQEQDEVIHTLRTQGNVSNEQLSVLIRIIIGSSLFLHVLYLIHGDNPLNAFLTPAPPIPQAILFAIVNIAVLGNLFLLSWSGHPALQHIPTLPHTAMYGASVLAPLFCLFSGRGLVDVVWWMMTLVTVAFQHLLHRSITEVEQEIAELERLKYNAKGA